MAHLAGERLHCDECGAEILYVKACTCPDTEPKKHQDICCGKEMRSLGGGSATESASSTGSGAHHHR